jgi:hypothetical protein
MAKKIAEPLLAYLADGTQITFKHAVDRRDALNRGMLQFPPGQKPPEKAVVVEGEKATGIEPIGSPVKKEEESLDDMTVAELKTAILKLDPDETFKDMKKADLIILLQNLRS